LRQGEFLSPQSISAVAASPDGRQLAVTTMGFRHDRNFWLHGNNDILNRCWGDVPKARAVMRILREQVLPLKPEIVFTGHDEHSNGVEYWEGILRRSEDALRDAGTRRNQ
jgi:hypothetical protein